MALLQQIESVTIAGLGAVPLVDNDAEFQPSQTEKELVEGMKAGDGGFIRKKNTGAQLDISVLHRAGFDVQSFNAMNNVMITIKYTDGETHIMPEAACVKAIKGGKDGKFKAEFHSAESRKR
jgi:hypothetical protein